MTMDNPLYMPKGWRAGSVRLQPTVAHQESGGTYVKGFRLTGATGALSAVALSDTTVQLAFTEANGATSHEYRVSGGAPVALAGDKVVTGLTTATAYDFEVRGVNAVGPGPWSNVASATTL